MQGGYGQSAPLNCPHSLLNAPGAPGDRLVAAVTGEAASEAYWGQVLASVLAGARAVNTGDFVTARSLLGEVLMSSTAGLAADPVAGLACSLGVAAAYRVLALAFAYDNRLLQGTWAFRRSYQIALRFQHLAMVWITHAWEKYARREVPGTGLASYYKEYIDDSAWPISLQEINVEMTVVQNALKDEGRQGGHTPRWRDVPDDFRDPSLRLGIVSLCAYPPGHVLPKYASSNHQIYAKRYGYAYHVGRELNDAGRPPAWGKIQLMSQAIDTPDVDWWLWFDCDTYFMNMNVTLDSILYKYGRALSDRGDDGKPRLDPNFHMLVAEDHAMLNTGAFFLRSSDWSRNFLRNVWGPENSAWTEHPWWENAAIIWNFLKDNSQKFLTEDPATASAEKQATDEMEGIYPPEVRLSPQSEFNSYHPATAQFLHDTWEPGKFAIAFNGVLSNTSPQVIRALYGNYYEWSCQLNGVTDQCIAVEEALPWL